RGVRRFPWVLVALRHVMAAAAGAAAGRAWSGLALEEIEVPATVLGHRFLGDDLVGRVEREALLASGRRRLQQDLDRVVEIAALTRHVIGDHLVEGAVLDPLAGGLVAAAGGDE